MQPFPWWVAASIELAVGVVITAGISIIGLWVKANYATPTTSTNHLFDYGLWFCAYGLFGNGCWTGLN